ncbi:MAG: hypothetical protein CMM43_06850 [Rhodospirillaceae bacterium]|nr:hypothetical protein [Rhodospirillaceae bacterium]|tara:strand:+ start:6695 stop:7351 length:657 start_codon:yes stop_codon:yes gene_type:complete
MSLKAALKAGLEALEENNNFQKKTGLDPSVSPKTLRPSLMQKGQKGASLEAKKSKISENFSDSLPIPELTSPSVKRAANLNRRVKIQMEQKADRHSNELAIKKPGNESSHEGTVNGRQYVVELDRFLNSQNNNLTQGVVLDVSSHEIEQVIKLSARVRGRYIAKVLDIGRSETGGLKESELLELRRHRQSCEELSLGIDILKEAISVGDISVTGRVKG